jgi:tetratricopeptide (TPR) repeat protein
LINTIPSNNNDIDEIKKSNIALKNIKYSDNKLNINTIIDILNYSISTNNNFYSPYIYLNQLLSISHKYDSAIKLNHTCLSLNPPSDWKSRIYNNIGVIAHINAKYDDAITYYTKAISSYDYSRPHINLGFVYININRFDLAFKQIEIGIDQIKYRTSSKLRHKHIKDVLSFKESHSDTYNKAIKSNKLFYNLFNNIRGYIP